jgi:hypothetical protein
MSQKLRNNLIIDFITAMIGDPNNSVNQWNPQSFEEHRRTSRMLKLLEHGVEVDENATLSELEAKIKELGISDESLNILYPSTQIYFHNQNSVAARLIGMIATHKKNHALRQFINDNIVNMEEAIKQRKNKDEGKP